MNASLHRQPSVQAPEAAMNMLECMTKAQTMLSQADTPDIDGRIEDALALIGGVFGADRAYVFKFTDPLYLRNTHEWCAPGIRALKGELQQAPYAIAEQFWTAFNTHGALLLHDIAAVPAGSDLRAMLQGQEVKSLIAVPIWQDRQLAGLTGMDFCRAKRLFSASDATYLQGFAATLGFALQACELTRHKRQTEADLRAANERLSAMVDTMPELLVETNRNGLITSFHQSAPMTLALTPVEVIGKPPEDLMPPHVAAMCRKAMAQVDESGWSETFVYSLMIEDQEKHYALHATSKGHAHSPRRNGYIFVVREVTESHRQDMHMRQLGRVAELSTNLIFLTDADRYVTWVNPASTRRTGYTLEEAMGKRPSEILGLARYDPDRAEALCAKLGAGDDIHEDVQAASKAGIPYWVSLNVQRLTDADGTVQGFMVVGTDVTAHILAETRALRDRSSAMNALSEGIAIIQPDGTVAYMNLALRSFLNIPESTPADTLSWHDISPDGFNRQLVGMLPQLYADGVWRGEINLSDIDTDERHFDISISVQEDGSFLFISHDITARKIAERDQALLREQLQIAQSRQLVAQLAGGLAHDVANVLAVISGVIETLRPAQRPKARRALERIDAAATQAQALVTNLSQLGQRRTTRNLLDLRPLVQQAAELVRPSLGNKSRLELDLPDNPVAVIGDRTGIMQVLLNLLLNARDALRATAEPMDKITLRLHPPRALDTAPDIDIGQITPGLEYAVIEITDTGAGLDDAEKAMMFTPYFSTKGQNGVGLGLSIVADILTSNLGAIRITSQRDHGTKVQVFWPVCAEMADARADIARPRAQGAAPLTGCHILLVDDDDAELMRIAQLLSAAGAEVASCIDPRDALAAVRDSPEEWDVIITDHDMGPMSGQKLAQKIHAISPNLPIILATGAAPLQNATKSAHSEFISVLRKPVTEAVIVAVLLDAVLRRKHTSQAAAHVDANITGG